MEFLPMKPDESVQVAISAGISTQIDFRLLGDGGNCKQRWQLNMIK